MTDGLNIVEMLQSMIELPEIERLGKRQRGNGLADIVELLDTAYAAARAASQRAATLFEPHKAAAGQLDLYFETVADVDHVHAVDFLRLLDNAFR
ncbi:hypothetical protein D3C86_1695440 [compost metagenome]